MRLREAIALAIALALAPAGARGGDGSVVLRWKPVEGAVSYELEIGSDPELRSVIVRERVPTPGYRWRELPDQRRWWRARGVDERGRPGRWSDVRALEPVLRAPEPRAPADGAALPGGEEVELACAPSPVAARYELEVATDAGFAAVVERRDGREPRFRVALPPGFYHWRMRASVDARTTGWSGGRRVSVEELPVATVAPASPIATSPETEPPAAETATESEDEADARATQELAAALAAAIIAGAPAPVPEAAAEPAAAPIADSALGVAEARRFRPGLRLGWHTTFGAISTVTPGVEAEWRIPRHERLSLSGRLEYYGVTTSVAPMPGLATPLTATARVVPLGAALVWGRPLRSLHLYGGAGGQAQLVYTAVAGAARLDLVPGALLLAGVARRLGTGDVFVEATWASGELDSELARLRTGGFSLSAGFRGWP